MDDSDNYATTFDTDQIIDVRTVGDLKQLIDMLESAGIDVDESPVHFAIQPNWPMAYKVSSAVIHHNEDDEPVLWLVEDRQLGYLPGDVQSKIGW